VLICEDEPMLRLNLKEVLEDEGFDVTATGTLSEALAQDWQGIDALVTDMNLPDGTGISVMSGARAMKPGLPAIVASGALVKDPLLLTPQTRLLLKPFAHDVLVETLRKLLEPGL
jgi:CheY-like chemotaxis protein